ncbi:MAG: DUF2075 domain-containing protein [Sphingobacteriales bacterium]|nr:MAG: DUF2075 domain-containing protein [Sphingobacteriales bacterium]
MASFYNGTLLQHNTTPIDEIVGVLSRAYGKQHLDLKKNQTESWAETVCILKLLYVTLMPKVSGLQNWTVLYEYKIPRRAKRIDVVLLSPTLIFVLELKNNKRSFDSADKIQLEDYCLDLRDFHYESKDKIVIPILLCTGAQSIDNTFSLNDDLVQHVLYTNKENVADVICKAYSFYSNATGNINAAYWNNSKYFPTPTIIEAAQTLYSKQSVVEISRSHAGAENLSKTTEAVLHSIRQAQESHSKIICFITGVPGAGKTLAGLNIVHNRDFQSENQELGVFLSGNSPLVKVLSEALARDFTAREKITKPEAKRRVKTFIHNVHEFIDEYYDEKNKLPVDHVLIYDEAQRAWTKEHKTRKSNGLITESEPEILLSIMDRLPDWGVIIALVGGGQEINTGEAGLREWGKAIETRFSGWKVYISPELKDGDHSTANLKLFEQLPKNVEIFENSNLHLSVAIRSYKAQKLSQWVSLVLDNKSYEAKEVLLKHLKDYPIFITREIENVKAFLKSKARGTRRTGLVASSGGRRLKALGYDPFYGLRGDSSQDELGAWYLNPPDDVRSSNFREIISTEYAVQGLELDWVGLLWDCDLRRTGNEWEFKQFKGTKWQNVGDAQRRQFILNKYRVLLTRAREGTIIYLPEGNKYDETRKPEIYDQIFAYLLSCGVYHLSD